MPAISIGELLRSVTRSVGHIDLVKIDTEGSELELLRAIPPEIPVRALVYEDETGRTRWRQD